MITKAIVDDASDKYEIKVRIPLLDRASVDPRYVADAYLPSAPICTLPNTGLNLRKGDVVWVSFENGDPSRPVIVGCLYTDKVSETEASTILNSLSVSADAKLPQNTTIGEVSSEELGYLEGLGSNVQAQIDSIKDTMTTPHILYLHSITLDMRGGGGQRPHLVKCHIINSDESAFSNDDFSLVAKESVLDYAGVIEVDDTISGYSVLRFPYSFSGHGNNFDSPSIEFLFIDSDNNVETVLPSGFNRTLVYDTVTEL